MKRPDSVLNIFINGSSMYWKKLEHFHTSCFHIVKNHICLTIWNKMVKLLCPSKMFVLKIQLQKSSLKYNEKQSPGLHKTEISRNNNILVATIVSWAEHFKCQLHLLLRLLHLSATARRYITEQWKCFIIQPQCFWMCLIKNLQSVFCASLEIIQEGERIWHFNCVCTRLIK